MSCGMSKGSGAVGQALVDQRPVFDSGRRPRKTVYSRKGGVLRPSKKHPKNKFL